MGLPTVNINITDGGLGRTTPSLDGVSAFPFLNNNIADLTQFTTTDRVLSFNTLSAVEKTGITATSTNFQKEYYILKRFFQMGGQKVYVGIFPSTDTFSDGIDAINAYTNGEVRIYGVADSAALLEANIATLNAKMVSLADAKKPAHLVYTALTGSLTFASLPDLRDLTSEARYVSVMIGQDSANYPSTISTGVADLGGIVGALSSTDVATSILDHSLFNYNQGADMILPAFVVTDNAVANTLIPINDIRIDESVLTSLNEKGYLFYHYEANQAGVFLSNAHTCAAIDSDYTYIQNVRVIEKSLRVADAVLTPKIGSKIAINANGTIKQSQISAYDTILRNEFKKMIDANEIAGVAIYIDPTQTPLVNNTLNVQIGVQPYPTSDYINVDLGFTLTV